MSLTRMQLRVAALVAEDFTNGQIARALDLSETAVKSHVYEAMKRLGAASRVGVALWYVRYHGAPMAAADEGSISPQEAWIAGRASALQKLGASEVEARRAAERAWERLPDFRRRLYAASVPARPACDVLGPRGAH